MKISSRRQTLIEERDNINNNVRAGDWKKEFYFENFL